MAVALPPLYSAGSTRHNALQRLANLYKGREKWNWKSMAPTSLFKLDIADIALTGREQFHWFQTWNRFVTVENALYKNSCSHALYRS
jgi:hypothetical protein